MTWSVDLHLGKQYNVNKYVFENNKTVMEIIFDDFSKLWLWIIKL